MITYGSVCSGIEAASVAWEPLGWRPKFFAEIEAFPSAVLAHHYGSNLPGEPLSKNGVPNYGDFTTISGDAGPVDLLVGGTPCQSFSVAGKRLGLDDPRGNLALEYIRLAKRLGARWVVWENVPGVFSSAAGRDFADFLGCFPRAVPQRRKRVFVVGYLGDWRRAAAVLFEPEGMSGHPAPRRKTGQGIAASLTASAGGVSQKDAIDGRVILNDEVAGTVSAKWAKGTGGPAGDEVQNLVAHTLRGEGFDAGEDGSGRGTPLVAVPDVAATLTRGAESSGKGGCAGRRQEDDQNLVAFAIQENAGAEKLSTGPQGAGFQADIGFTLEARHRTQSVAFSAMPMNSGKDFTIRETEVAQPVMAAGQMLGDQGGDLIIAFDTTQITSPTNGSNPKSGDPAHSLSAKAHPPAIAGAVVRKLMPPECARLQGFADDRCRIPWKGRPAEKCPDGPQYKAYGNSMAVNVMRWIGMRIDLIERLVREGKVP